MNLHSVNKVALAGVCAAALVACSKPEPAPEPIRAVKVMTVAVSGMGAQVQYAAEVRAQVEARLGFRVAGKLVRRQAEVGQRVKAGQVLAQLDPQDYKLATDAAKSQLEAAVTNRDLTVAELKRFRGLKEQNFVSGVELDRREAAVKAAEAQVAQAQAQVSAQGNQSAYATLASDVAGVITGVSAEPGQVVGAGMPVVSVALDGARDVVFSVPEDRIMALPIGSPVEVRLWSVGTTFKAAVREKAAIADPVTRTYQVKASLEAGSIAPPLGSTVTVIPQALSAKGKEVIKLPLSALKQEGKSTAVWLVNPNLTLASQVVEVAALDGNEAVIGAGLQPGQQVVIAGVHMLNPGQTVTIYKPRGAAAAQVPVVPPSSNAAMAPAAPSSSVK
jgi:multidrug efflux system membrane fusion protein